MVRRADPIANTDGSCASHRLSPLLAPRSIALVGASGQEGTVGYWTRKTLLGGRFDGDIYLINPKYETLDGLSCYANLSALPQVPDMAILNVSSRRIEALFDEAIEAGVKAITIFDPCLLEQDTDPPLLTRLRGKAQAANIPVCGGNGMGFYDLDKGLFASFYEANTLHSGHITLVAHSGSVFTVLTHNDRRYRYNLAISPGHEIGASVDEYVEYALELASTRVVALFIEAVRNPTGFSRALEKARERGVPVVICKVGRTEKSARLALTHTGAVAGDDAAFDAVCARHGALRVQSMDELMTTALLLSQPRRSGAGGLASLTDSGGLREMWIDLAEEIGVPFAKLSSETLSELSARLPFELDADNPLDGAGPLGPEFARVFEDCLPILMNDPDTAIGCLEFDIRDGAPSYLSGLVEVVKRMSGCSGKPFFVVNSFVGAQNSELAEDFLESSSVPLLNGAEMALKAVHHAFSYRDHRAGPTVKKPQLPDTGTVSRWRSRLSGDQPADEVLGLAMLQDFGIDAVRAIAVNDEDDLLSASTKIGFPLVLKTANPEIAHKSDVGGVHLGISDSENLVRIYRTMASRLGPLATIQPMADKGVELSFGLIADRQFGPVVMIGIGGLMIELLDDRVFAIAPFDENEAMRLIDRLKLRRLLDGVRGQPSANLDSIAHAFSCFSVLADSLSDYILEMDVNPVIAGTDGCLAVDVLVVRAT